MLCSVANCAIRVSITHNKSGMCSKHVTKHLNDATTAARRAARPLCSVDGCLKRLKVGNAIGVCRAHREHGRPCEKVIANRTGKAPQRTCNYTGCCINIRSNNKAGLCLRHRDTAPDRAGNRRTPEQRLAFREYQANYRSRNRELVLAQAREYARNNRPAMRARRALWAHDNPIKEVARVQRRRAAKRQAEGFWTESEWLDILGAYGNLCPNCGAGEDMTVDHVIPLSRGGSNWPSNLQPLCRRCNSSKRHFNAIRFLPWNGQAPRIDTGV